MPNVGFKAKEPFDQRTFGHRVNQPIVEINRMLESRGPLYCRKSGAVEERAHAYSKLIVVNFDDAILGRTVRAGRFDSVVMVAEYHIAELDQTGKFPLNLSKLIRHRGVQIALGRLSQAGTWTLCGIPKHVSMPHQWSVDMT